MKLKVDLSTELARLLNFTATVAIAIRMYSAYNSSGARHEDAPNDLMWLSDSLHNFDMLGNAILAGIPENILFACDSLLKAFQSYQEVFPGSTRQAKPTFERNSQHVDLKVAMAIFTDIRVKVLQAIVADDVVASNGNGKIGILDAAGKVAFRVNLLDDGSLCVECGDVVKVDGVVLDTRLTIAPASKLQGADEETAVPCGSAS